MQINVLIGGTEKSIFLIKTFVKPMYLSYWFTFLQMDVSIMLSIIQQIISLLQWQSHILWMTQECVGLSEELFLMCKSV